MEGVGGQDLERVDFGLQFEGEVLHRKLKHAQVQVLPPRVQLLYRLSFRVHRRLRHDPHVGTS